MLSSKVYGLLNALLFSGLGTAGCGAVLIFEFYVSLHLEETLKRGL